MTESTPISFSINNIRVVHSQLDCEKTDSLNDDLKLITDVEVALVQEKSLLEVTVSFEIADSNSGQLRAFLKVLNSFSIEQIDKHISSAKSTDKGSLSTNVLDHFLSLSSSHTRGIFSHFSKGTPFEHLMVPNLRSSDLSP